MTLPLGPDEEAAISLPQVRQFTSRLGVIGFGQALTFVAGIANQVVLAHALGVTAYGQYGLVGVSAALLGWFLGIGLNVATPALVRGDPRRARTVVTLAGGYLVLLGALAGVGFVLLPAAAVRALSPNLATTAGRWLLPTAVVALAFLVALGLLLGLGAFIAHAGVSFANSLLLLVLNLRLLAVAEPERLEAALLNLNVAYLGAVGLTLWVLGRRRALGPGVGWRSLLAERRHATLRIYVSNLVRLGLLRAPYYAADRLLGPRALGLYALADYLMNLLWRPAGIAGQVLLASASIDRDATSPTMVTWLSRVLSAGTACVLVGLALLGRRGIGIAFGHAFSDTYGILMAALPGIWAYSVLVAVDYYYAAHDYPWTMGVAFGVGAATTIAGALVLAGWGGVVGVAGAYGISLVIVFLIIEGSFVRRAQTSWASLIIPRPADWTALGALVRRGA